MQPLAPPASAFHELPPPVPLVCGTSAHPVLPTNLDDGAATLHARHDRLRRTRHVGWYTDSLREATLAGHVYVLESTRDDAPDTYYAAALADDADVHYLDPEPYAEPLDAAHAADELARTIAEHDLELDDLRNAAASLRCDLRDARRLLADAFRLLRHARACPDAADDLGPGFQRLHAQASALRARVHAHRAQARAHPPRPGTPDDHPVRQRWRAWRDAWDNA